MSNIQFPQPPPDDEGRKKMLEDKERIMNDLRYVDELMIRGKMVYEKPAILETLKHKTESYREEMKKLNDQFELQLQQATASFNDMVLWFNTNTDIDTDRSNISMLDELRLYLSEGYDMPPDNVLIGCGIYRKCPNVPSDETHHFIRWLEDHC